MGCTINSVFVYVVLYQSQCFECYKFANMYFAATN